MDSSIKTWIVTEKTKATFDDCGFSNSSQQLFRSRLKVVIVPERNVLTKKKQIHRITLTTLKNTGSNGKTCFFYITKNYDS